MAVAPHRGPWRDSVLDLKYRADTPRARDLAHEMNHSLLHAHSFDAVTWIPTTDRRRRHRGFDQAELIARHLASLRGASAKKLLRRPGNSHQSGMSREVRLLRPQFIAHPGCEGLVVLVVDDVTTTGATFREAARALLHVGASGVVCCSATYAPLEQMNSWQS